jgi:hypothetical protein
VCFEYIFSSNGLAYVGDRCCYRSDNGVPALGIAFFETRHFQKKIFFNFCWKKVSEFESFFLHLCFLFIFTIEHKMKSGIYSFFCTSSSLGFASAAAFKKYQLGITSNFVSVSKLKLNKNLILTFKCNKDEECYPLHHNYCFQHFDEIKNVACIRKYYDQK